MDAGVLCQPEARTSSDRSLDDLASGPPVRKKGTASKVSVLELARQLGNVSRACELMGYSRDSFYRFKRLYESGGEAALRDASRRKPIVKNRVAPEVEAAVLELTFEHPAWGQARVAAELRNRGVNISPAGVRCVWLRHSLQKVSLRRDAVAVRNTAEGPKAG